MSDILLGRPARVRDSDLPPISLAFLADQAALQELNPKQYVAWKKLLHHLLKYGQLPTGYKSLAAICKVTPRSFELMAPALALHLDGDADGRWTHWDIIEARGDQPVTPAFEIGAVAAELSVKRSRSGTAGAAARWGKKPHLELVADMQTDEPQADGKTMPTDMAKFDGKSIGKIDELANPVASPPRPELASLLSSESDLNQKLTSQPADGARAPGEAKPMANADDPDGKTAGAAMANPMATSEPSDTAIIDAVIRVCGDKVSKGDVHTALPVYRAALAEGIDFFKDVVPKVQAFARNKSVIDNPANKHIMKDAREHCASRLAAEQLATSRQRPAPVFTDPLLALFAVELRARVGADAFASWFGGLAVAARSETELTLSLPKKFVRDHVARVFENQALAALRAAEPSLKRVVFVVQPSGN